MTWLSEESRLLVENWDTVEDIFQAVERLQAELNSLLQSTEDQLAERHWWHDGWRFLPYTSAQVYISRANWWVDGAYLIWIGVERFTPSALFGKDSSPQLYVWVQNNQDSLAQVLARGIEKRGSDTLGNVDHSQSAYVVKHAMQKCLPGEVEGLEEEVAREVVDFFDHWAQALSHYDRTIQDYIVGWEGNAPAASPPSA
jgi:hypothetical protein